MRKWFCLGIVTLAASCVGGYWLSSKPAPIGPVTIRPAPIQGAEKHDGGAEASDTIEPLVVDQVGGVVVRPIPLANDEMMPRVVFAPGMVQPPRPDADYTKAPRMPYADEQEILAMPLDPIARILEAARPSVNVFEGFELFFEEILPGSARPEPGYHRANPDRRIPFCER